MMCYYSPRLSKLNKYLLFKALDTQNTGKITLSQFYNFYEFVNLKYEKSEIRTPFYMQFNSKCIVDAGHLITKIVKSPYFEVYVYISIFLSVFWQLMEINFPDNKVLINGLDKIIHVETSTLSLIFIVLFTVEILMKIIALDLNNFFKDRWNMFDFAVILTSIVGLLFSIFNLSFAFIYVLRCARLLKLLELKKSYRNVMDSFMVIMVRRFASVSLVVILTYYSFAVVGMELFSDLDLRDCCENTEFAANFRTGKNGTENGYYYLNNFQNIFISYGTSCLHFLTMFSIIVDQLVN